MSAVLTRRRHPRDRSRERDRETGGQASLFGQVVAPPRPREVDDRAVADRAIADRAIADRAVAEPLAGPTLDAAISSLWSGLSAGEPGACPACGEAMRPRYSAGAGVVGGRCDSCSLTLA
jgi:hypothetical protein